MKCPPTCTECCCKPCDLCKQREQYADIFVAVTKDGGPGIKLTHFVCGHCIPTHAPAIDVSLDETQVWNVGSDGWLEAISCMDCGEDIPVTIGRIESGEA